MRMKVIRSNFVALGLLLGSEAAVATMVWGPDGAYTITESSSGYVISSMTGGGNTLVTRTSTGYVIQSPDKPDVYIDNTGPGPELVPVLPGGVTAEPPKINTDVFDSRF